MRVSYLLNFCVLIVTSCVSELEVPVIHNARTLVVDGLISDQPGPHTVSLSWSASLDEDVLPLGEATVRIIENGSTIHPLSEAAAGTYQTGEEFAGTIGHTYKLEIETADGKRYESPAEEMKSAGVLEKVYFELKENAINQGDLTKPQDALYFYIDGSSAESGTNQLRWRWQATYQIHTTPKDKVIYTQSGPIPAPAPCSGYAYDGEGLIYQGPCTCCECWITLYDRNVNLSDPAITDGVTYKKVYVGLLPLENKYFYEKLLIRAEQLSLSDTSYPFWHLVDTQQESGENIFQPNVVKVIGNVVSVTDPTEEVFGIFSVSAISSQRLEIRWEDIDKRMPELEFVSDDCRLVGGATNEKPAFY